MSSFHYLLQNFDKLDGYWYLNQIFEVFTINILYSILQFINKNENSMCNIKYCILVILASDLPLVSVGIKGNYRSHFYVACFSRAANHPQPVEGSPYKPQRPPAAPPSPAAYANYPPNHNSLRYVQQQSPYGTTVPYRENPYSVRTPVSSSIQAP